VERFFVAQQMARRMVQHGYGPASSIRFRDERLRVMQGCTVWSQRRGGVRTSLTMSLADDWGKPTELP